VSETAVIEATVRPAMDAVMPNPSSFFKLIMEKRCSLMMKVGVG
jgi:hypothetical protein